jgi:hypothetical protein
VQGMRVLEGLQQAGGVDDALPGSAFVQHHGFFHVAPHVMKALPMRPPGEHRVELHSNCIRRQAMVGR